MRYEAVIAIGAALVVLFFFCRKSTRRTTALVVCPPVTLWCFYMAVWYFPKYEMPDPWIAYGWLPITIFLGAVYGLGAVAAWRRISCFSPCSDH